MKDNFEPQVSMTNQGKFLKTNLDLCFAYVTLFFFLYAYLLAFNHPWPKNFLSHNIEQTNIVCDMGLTMKNHFFIHQSL